MELDNLIVTKLFDVMTIHIPTGTYRQITDRFAYGLTFCESPEGQIIYELDGRQYVSDYDHCVLLPMGRTYMLRGTRGANFPLINFYSSEPVNERNFAVFPLSSPGYYLHTYEKIKSLCRYNQPYCQANAMSLFYEMISHLMADPREEDNSVLTAAVAYMDSNFSDPELSMEQVAQQAHVSPGYLRRLFKARYSMPPKKYILNARMVRAKELLLSAECSTIRDVALSCGYTNIYHFDRVFREFFGCSPTEYQQRFAYKL